MLQSESKVPSVLSWQKNNWKQYLSHSFKAVMFTMY